jgi:hypothetical protein
MSTAAGPNVVTNGLILNLDAANRKSYIGGAPASLINTNSWTIGSGSVDGYGENGPSVENARLYDTDPWGNQSIVWGTYASGDGNADGGWNSSYPAIDSSKLYRFSVWVRRTSATSGGTFYFGTGAGGAEVRRTDNSATQGNPYWECQNTGVLTQNQWYLVCGHVYPSDTTFTGRNPNTGYFTIAGGTTKVMEVNGCNIGQDLKWDAASTSAVHRTYHFYCPDATTRLQFMAPRIDLCDGNEPSIADLLTYGSSVWKDVSGSNNHHTVLYSPTYTAKSFGLNDTNYFQRLAALSGVSNSCTVVIWYKTTDTQELWVRGNSSNGTYLSAASGGGAYYHSNVGTPINYIDTTVQTIPAPFRNGQYHMWEAKNVDFSTWAAFDWFGYPGGWQLIGSVGGIMVYNRSLTATESMQNFNALRSRYGI